MRKKIPPIDAKNQTRELKRANIEFIKRNKEKLDKISKLETENNETYKEWANQRPEWAVALLEIAGIKPVTDELKEALNECDVPQAANAYHGFIDFLNANESLISKIYKEAAESVNIPPVPFDPEKTLDELNIAQEAYSAAFEVEFGKRFSEIANKDEYRKKINKDCIEMLARDASQIFRTLTNDNPLHYLLLGIDLRRSKEVILAEVDNLISRYQPMHKNDGVRLKWLPIVDELLDVWDLYDQAGKQPTKTTFKQIAKKVNRPLSTVKDQWRTAYEKIYGTPYKPELKYSSEEKRADATQLCAKCPHITPRGVPCYKGGEQYPCAEYLKIAGKERIIKQTEYNDNILYRNSDD